VSVPGGDLYGEWEEWVVGAGRDGRRRCWARSRSRSRRETEQTKDSRRGGGALHYLTLKGHHDASDVNNLVDWMLRMAMSSSSVGGFLLGSPKAGYEWPAVFNGGKSTKTVIFPVLPWCWQRVAGCEWTEGRRGLGNAMLFDDG
jgi:hypothetical protein